MLYYRDWENRLYYSEMLMKLKICIFQNIQLFKDWKITDFHTYHVFSIKN
jgi:hypothetical protein